jgi:hypothetical protein
LWFTQPKPEYSRLRIRQSSYFTGGEGSRSISHDNGVECYLNM